MRRITVRLGDYVEEQKRRDRRGGRIVAALAIAAALVIAMSGTTTTSTPAVQNGSPAHLATSSVALQFAPQLAGTTSPAQLLQLRNDGGTALTIAKVDVDNKAFQLSHDCAALAPNESCSAAVVFAPSADGAQRGTLGVETTSGTKTIALEGEGRAIPAVDLGPTDFGNAPVGGVAERSIRFVNAGPSPIAVAKSDAGAPFAIAADTCSGIVNPGGNCEVRVQFHPAAAGNAAGELLLTAASGAVVAKGSLLGAGSEATQPGKPAQLVVSPADRIVFPPQTPGVASGPQLVQVKNAGDEPLAIDSIATDGPFRAANDCGNSLLGNASCSVSVVFVPSPAAAISKGALAINTKGGNAVVQLQAEVRQVPPVDLPLTDFGRTFVGAAVERTVRFTNSAPATIVVGRAISPPPFEIVVDGCRGAKVAPGGSCEVRLQFRPTVNGSTQGVLTLVDLRGATVARGELRGLGLEKRPPRLPSIGINPHEINFHGEPGQKTIVVTNTGAVPVSVVAKPETSSRYLIDTKPCNVTLAPGQPCTIVVDGRYAVHIGASARVAITYLGRTEYVPVLPK